MANEIIEVTVENGVERFEVNIYDCDGVSPLQQKAINDGDAALQQSIDAVAGASGTGDAALGNAIALEKTNRENADAGLQNAIDAIIDDSLNSDLAKTWSIDKIKAELTTAIDNLINGAPGALDTLNELAQALEANDVDINAVLTAQANRVRVDAAQGLSEYQKVQGRENIGAASVGDLNAERTARLLGDAENYPHKVLEIGRAKRAISPANYTAAETHTNNDASEDAVNDLAEFYQGLDDLGIKNHVDFTPVGSRWGVDVTALGFAPEKPVTLGSIVGTTTRDEHKVSGDFSAFTNANGVQMPNAVDQATDPYIMLAVMSQAVPLDYGETERVSSVRRIIVGSLNGTYNQIQLGIGHVGGNTTNLLGRFYCGVSDRFLGGAKYFNCNNAGGLTTFGFLYGTSNTDIKLVCNQEVETADINAGKGMYNLSGYPVRLAPDSQWSDVDGNTGSIYGALRIYRSASISDITLSKLHNLMLATVFRNSLTHKRHCIISTDGQSNNDARMVYHIHREYGHIHHYGHGMFNRDGATPIEQWIGADLKRGDVYDHDKYLTQNSTLPPIGLGAVDNVLMWMQGEHNTETPIANVLDYPRKLNALYNNYCQDVDHGSNSLFVAGLIYYSHSRMTEVGRANFTISGLTGDLVGANGAYVITPSNDLNDGFTWTKGAYTITQNIDSKWELKETGVVVMTSIEAQEYPSVVDNWDTAIPTFSEHITGKVMLLRKLVREWCDNNPYAAYYDTKGCERSADATGVGDPTHMTDAGYMVAGDRAVVALELLRSRF